MSKVNDAATMGRVATIISDQLDTTRALTNAPMRIPVHKPELGTEEQQHQKGNIVMRFCTNDPQKMAAQLIEQGRAAVAAHEHYDITQLSGDEDAHFRAQIMQYLLVDGKAAFVAVRRIAIDAYKAQDWKHLLEAEARPKDVRDLYHAYFEAVFFEDNDIADIGEQRPAQPMENTAPDRASLRAKWIEQLSVEVPFVFGPLSLNPIKPKDADTAEAFRRLYAWFHEKRAQGSVQRLDLLFAQEKIDHLDFERHGRISCAKEVISDLRELDLSDPDDQCTFKMLVLLALAGTQKEVRRFRKMNNMMDTPRKKRSAVNPKHVIYVDLHGNVVGESEVLILTFPPDQHERIVCALRSDFEVGPAEREIRQVVNEHAKGDTAKS